MTRCFPEVPVRRWTLNILQALDIVSSAKFQKFIGPPFALGGAWKSRSSRKRKQQPWRPALPAHIRHLIVEMAKANPTWGEQRTANELKLKLGIQVSPRTVRKYLNALRSRRGCGQQRWNSFIRHHGKATVAWPVTSSCPSPPRRIFYVFVAMGIGSRRILPPNIQPPSRPFSSSVSSWPSRVSVGIPALTRSKLRGPSRRSKPTSVWTKTPVRARAHLDIRWRHVTTVAIPEIVRVGPEIDSQTSLPPRERQFSVAGQIGKKRLLHTRRPGIGTDCG